MPILRHALHSLLHDIALEGVVIISKRKLLRLLDVRQDRASAWEALLAEWEEIGESRNDLWGFEIWDRLVLAKAKPLPELVASWAD